MSVKMLFILFLLVIGNYNYSYAQKLPKLAKDANNFYKAGKYEQALKICEVILLNDSESVDDLSAKASASWILSWIYKNLNYSSRDVNRSYQYLQTTSSLYDLLLSKYPELQKYMVSLTNAVNTEKDQMIKLYPGVDKNMYAILNVFQNNKSSGEDGETNKEIKSDDVLMQRSDSLIKSKEESTVNDKSQTDKTVTLTVVGQGKTQEDTRKIAFINAIEQAFGTFITTNTVILNDKLIKDEIITLSNGNIQNYSIISEEKTENGNYFGTYKVVVSVDQLKTFCESKGIKVEFQGGLFAMNIKLQAIAEQSELIAVWNVLFMLNPILNKSFDYKAQTFDPISIEGNNKFKVRFLVDCIGNKNQEFVFDYLNKFLVGISLSINERKNYEKLNKLIWGIKVDGNEYYLRNKESYDAFENFFKEILFIERRFIIEDNVKNLIGSHTSYSYTRRGNLEFEINNVYGASEYQENEDGLLVWKSSHSERKNDNYSGFEDLNARGKYSEGYFGFKYKDEDRYGMAYNKRITGEVIKTYDFSITYTLKELEKINAFNVYHISRNKKIGQWYKGGVIFYEDSIKSLIVPIGFKSFEYSTYQYCCDTTNADRQYKCPDIYICNINEYDLRDQLQDIFLKINTDTSIGSGYENSRKILSISSQYNTPFKFLKYKIIQGFNDWFIPSKLESELLINYSERYYPIFIQNIYTSSLIKEKHYRIKWDSFYKITKDFSYNEFNLPIIESDYNLFNLNTTGFIPIRVEKN
jgi:hypothetical protein